jgi:hypothetical protein
VKNNKGGIMAHSSIYGLNPILQSEILQCIDWKGELSNAFTTSPSKEHSEYVCGELSSSLLNREEMTAAIVQYINASALPPSYINQTTVKNALNAIKKDYPDIYADILKYKDGMSKVPNAPKLSELMFPTTVRWLANEQPVCIFRDPNSSKIHYQKMDNRVLRFLESLGEPDNATIKQFFMDIMQANEVTHTMSCYESHTMCDEIVDGKTQRVFLDFYVGPAHSVVFVRKQGMQAAGFYIIGTAASINTGKLAANQSAFGNAEGNKYEKYFKIMVNAWLAERTKLVEHTDEPLSSKNQVINLIGAKGDPKAYDMSARYRYIQVTDEAWKKYKESEAVFKQHCTDCNYTKAFWFRKSHFAQRNGNIYLVSAHWCHRTCAEVSPGPERPVVEVLV